MSWKYGSLDSDELLADLDQMVDVVANYPTGSDPDGIFLLQLHACRLHDWIQEHMRGYWEPASLFSCRCRHEKQTTVTVVTGYMCIFI